jgi:hypothetical protein
MRQTEAPCRINGLTITEIRFRRLLESFSIDVNYVLLSVGKTAIDTQTQGRMDQSGAGWSAKTERLLNELVDSIESDLMPLHFDSVDEGEKNAQSWIESGGDEAAGQV